MIVERALCVQRIMLAVFGGFQGRLLVMIVQTSLFRALSFLSFFFFSHRNAETLSLGLSHALYFPFSSVLIRNLYHTAYNRHLYFY